MDQTEVRMFGRNAKHNKPFNNMAVEGYGTGTCVALCRPDPPSNLEINPDFNKETVGVFRLRLAALWVKMVRG